MQRLAAILRLVTVVAVSQSGCTDGRIVMPSSDVPQLYVMLSPASGASEDTTLAALLLTTGSPIASDYRGAETFEMLRAADGASFDWRAPGVSGPAPVGALGTAGAANFVLPASGSAGLLGRRDLRSGERYALRVVTLGVVMSGDATIPAAPVPLLDSAGGAPIVRWPRANGAVGYLVLDGAGCGALTRDTLYVVPPAGVACHPSEGPRSIVVRALDPNLYAYLADDGLGSSGISSGYGVFGAFAESERVVLEPR